MMKRYGQVAQLLFEAVFFDVSNIVQVILFIEKLM